MVSFYESLQALSVFSFTVLAVFTLAHLVRIGFLCTCECCRSACLGRARSPSRQRRRRRRHWRYMEWLGPPQQLLFIMSLFATTFTLVLVARLWAFIQGEVLESHALLFVPVMLCKACVWVYLFMWCFMVEDALSSGARASSVMRCVVLGVVLFFEPVMNICLLSLSEPSSSWDVSESQSIAWCCIEVSLGLTLFVWVTKVQHWTSHKKLPAVSSTPIKSLLIPSLLSASLSLARLAVALSRPDRDGLANIMIIVCETLVMCVACHCTSWKWLPKCLLYGSRSYGACEDDSTRVSLIVYIESGTTDVVPYDQIQLPLCSSEQGNHACSSTCAVKRVI